MCPPERRRAPRCFFKIAEEFEKDVSDMCTYSQGVWEEASLFRAADAVKRIMSSLGCTLELALAAVGLTHEEWEEAEQMYAARGLEL